MLPNSLNLLVESFLLVLVIKYYQKYLYFTQVHLHYWSLYLYVKFFKNYLLKSLQMYLAPCLTSPNFDAVIIAHPLNVSKVAFHNFNEPIYIAAVKSPYNHTIPTFIKGDPNPKTFGYSGPWYSCTYPLDIYSDDL